MLTTQETKATNNGALARVNAAILSLQMCAISKTWSAVFRKMSSGVAAAIALK